ncbi:MAG TPA: hypothetical protein VGQ24_10030 [Gemmatimonadales bacterium]|jgi:hypothetical protein|nr:hypothetical protein [Gemmatimonadales bacterium]
MPNARFLPWLSALTAASVIVLPASALAQDKPKKERDLIAREELVEADAKFPDLFQAVKRLRPHFLAQNRGPRTTGIQAPAGGGSMCNATLEPNCAARQVVSTVVAQVVYLDGTKSGDPDVLKGIRTADVEEVRYLSPNRAASEYGLGHEGGVILVKRYNPTKP